MIKWRTIIGKERFHGKDHTAVNRRIIRTGTPYPIYARFAVAFIVYVLLMRSGLFGGAAEKGFVSEQEHEDMTETIQ